MSQNQTMPIRHLPALIGCSHKTTSSEPHFIFTAVYAAPYCRSSQTYCAPRHPNPVLALLTILAPLVAIMAGHIRWSHTSTLLRKDATKFLCNPSQ